ncbi:hypothetical protein Dimus_015558, partial [Dionaea muscipula]
GYWSGWLPASSALHFNSMHSMQHTACSSMLNACLIACSREAHAARSSTINNTSSYDPSPPGQRSPRGQLH